MANSKKNSKNSKKLSNRGRPANNKLITEETQDHIWQCFMRGLTYRATAESYNKEYKGWLKEKDRPKGITWQAIQGHHHRHLDDYHTHRDNKKQERLAAERARIAEMTDDHEQVKSELDVMRKTMSPAQRIEAGYLELLKEKRAILEQIAKDSGDRTDKGKGEGDKDKPSQVINIVNRIPGVWAGNEHSNSKQNGRIDLDRI